MTVAAIVAGRSSDDPLADAAGRAAVRRIVDVAWAGGALPIVVVAPDPAGEVAAAVAGAPAMVVPPTAAYGWSARVLAGARAAAETVSGTDAVLAWPVRMAWVDPETVTSLIEAHGVHPDLVIRPLTDGRPGWPVLVPLGLLGSEEQPVGRAAGDGSLGQDAPAPEDALEAPPVGPDALASSLSLEVGDPGAVLDLAHPLDALPPFAGPPEPAGGPPPEWGAAAAERADEA